jgi:hypothetical protein
MNRKKISLMLILTLVLAQISFSIIGLAEGPGEGPGEGPPSQWDPTNTKIISTTPSITPLFEMSGGGQEDGPPPGFYAAGFNAEAVTLDTEVEIKISATEKPFMLMNMGNLQSWSYDDVNKVVTVKTKPIDFYHIDQSSGQDFHMPEFNVVSFGPNPGGDGGKDQGPPAEAEGMWMATNASQWEMGPSKDYDGDGMPSSMVLELTGKAGAAGFFKMFWPTALLNKMGLTKDTIAGFINGTQASTTTQEVDGGVVVTFNVTYSSTGFGKPKLLKSAATTGFKTITVATGKAAALTLSLSKKSIKKGKAVSLSGFINPKRARANVFLYRKLKGEKHFKRVGVAKTNVKGFYKFTRKPPKTAYFRTATKKGSKFVYSEIIKVLVK